MGSFGKALTTAGQQIDQQCKKLTKKDTTKAMHHFAVYGAFVRKLCCLNEFHLLIVRGKF